MSKVLLDTNIVLRLLAETDPRHELASGAVADALRAGHEVHIAPQVVMEAWVVLTRPINVNGYGWAPPIAREALTGVIAQFVLSVESPAVFDEWWRVVATGVSGKRAHDARLAALMRVHGIEYVLTFNHDDFAGFDGIKTIVPGAAIPT
jgi:predicted nucleic acid-binding protein